MAPGRPLDELAAAPLTEGQVIGQPFFSGDGSWVGFYDGQDDSLNRVSTLGGPVLTICTGCVSTSFGVSWGSDDTILFGRSRPSGLWRIAAEGGEAVEVTTPEAPDVNHAWPEILPGGRAALFTTLVGELMETAQIAVVDLETGQHEVLIPGSYPRYAPTGHIVYGLAGSLWAVGFDVNQLEVSDERPVPVLDGVFTVRGGINFDFSLDGTLIYVQGPDSARSIERSLVWVDRQGAEVPLGLPDALYSGPRVSPDGTRVAVSVETPENTDIWVFEPASGTRTQLTTGPAPDTAPLWPPKGDRVVFTSRRDGDNALFLTAADGSGPAEHLLTVEDALALHAYSWSPDGNSLVFEYSTIDTLGDIGVVSLSDASRWETLIQTAASERAPAVSPDGRWIAYHSDESGRQEIFIEPFSGGGSRRPVSTSGGLQPMWSQDGRELLYRKGDDERVVVVPVEPSLDLVAGIEETLFGERYFFPDGFREYDWSSSNQRFLMMKPTTVDTERPDLSQIVVIQNWFDELQRLVPTPSRRHHGGACRQWHARADHRDQRRRDLVGATAAPR